MEKLVEFPQIGKEIKQFAAKMHLFISIDQIGATQAKFDRTILPLKPFDEQNKEQLRIPSWHRTLLSFHNEFDLVLKEILNVNFQNEEKIEFTIWKRLGDEILYKIELKNGIDAFKAIIVMMLTIKKYRTQRQILNCNYKPEQASHLNIKATFWMAGFPLLNLEIPKETMTNLLDGNRPNSHTLINQLSFSKASMLNGAIDYVGPSIDTGFRLTGKSDKNRIIISFEIAYLLAKIYSDANPGDEVRKIKDLLLEMKLFQGDKPELFDNIFFEGNTELKGVYRNEYNYPLFWITSPYKEDISNPNSVFYPACNPEKTLDNCTKFIQEMRNYILKPYIPGCKYLGEPPSNYMSYLECWNDFLDDEYKNAQHVHDNKINLPEDGIKIMQGNNTIAENAVNQVMGNINSNI